MKAILVEEDRKGYFRRYALTLDEFIEDFAERISEGMPPPTNFGEAYTLRPMVHVWYAETEVGSEEWNKFFTDMFYGSSEGDIKSGNAAEIDYRRVGVFADAIRETACVDICATFPMITERIQKKFAKEKQKAKKCQLYIPQICGSMGAACRCMGEVKGADRVPCTSCALAKFANEFRKEKKI